MSQWQFLDINLMFDESEKINNQKEINVMEKTLR